MGGAMEFEQMRQLDAIARTGTVSAAARELHLSQPALSRSVRRLEDELGVELFERSGRHVELNEVGRAALEWARQLLRDERLMRDCGCYRRSTGSRAACGHGGSGSALAAYGSHDGGVSA